MTANSSDGPKFLSRLIETIYVELQPDLAVPIRIVFCDRNRDGGFDRFAGLTRIRELLQQEHLKSSAFSPMLVLGVFSVGLNKTSTKEQELIALMQWPGVMYLPYGFKKEHLVAALLKVMQGSKSPLSPGILQTDEDILRVTSEVRHWLENRLRNTRGTLIDFRSAGQGEMQLHSAYLEPVAAISSAHRKMLDQLWTLEEAAERFAPGNGWVASAKAAVNEFEVHWQRLELSRSQIRSKDGTECTLLLGVAVKELEHSCNALAAAIDATNSLSREMVTSRGG